MNNIKILDNVTQNLTLIAEGTSYQSDISWASDKPDVTEIDGVVIRPAKGEINAEVTLTVTITSEFTVTVIAFEETDKEEAIQI